MLFTSMLCACVCVREREMKEGKRDGKGRQSLEVHDKEKVG